MTQVESPQPPSFQDELTETLKLAWPLALAFGGDQLLGVVDSLVAGRMGPVALAAVGVGNAVFMGMTILGVGLVGAVEPLASQAFGAGQPRKAHLAYRSAVLFSLLSTIPFMLGLEQVAALVGTWGTLEPAMKTAVQDYLFMRGFSVLPLFLYAAARNFLQSKRDTRAIVWSTIVANLLNIPLSIFLGFGDGGLTAAGVPAIGLGDGLGVAGLGLASTLVSVFRFLVLWHRISSVDTDERSYGGAWSGLGPLVRVGWPIGLHWFIEVGVFVTVTVLAGRFGTETVAAHQVALQLSTVTFCICLGLSSAATVRVGHAVGARKTDNVLRSGLTAVAAAVLFMSTTAFIFSAVPEFLAGCFSDDQQVVETAAQLLRIVAVFQVTDGIQAVMSGALRGIGDTRGPMLFNAFGHWCLGLPIGMYLAFSYGLGAKGLWWGLTIGLSFAAIVLSWRFFVRSRRVVEPLGFPLDEESV